MENFFADLGTWDYKHIVGLIIIVWILSDSPIKYAFYRWLRLPLPFQDFMIEQKQAQKEFRQNITRHEKECVEASKKVQEELVTLRESMKGLKISLDRLWDSKK